MFGARPRFKVFTCMQYFGGYIGEDESRCNFLKKRTATWERKIFTISETAGKYPHGGYAAVVRAIQLKWVFLQRLTVDIGEVFAGVEKTIRENFLPRLFFGKTKSLSPII